MRIIPAIDIIDGKCVRLTQGDYDCKKIYNEKPLEVAKAFEGSGIQFLHLVDLDGAMSNKIVNWKVLENICTKTSLKVDFGGGIKSEKSIRLALRCGANQVTGGSIAVKNKKMFTQWISKFGENKIILGADVQNKRIAINGWKEETSIELFDFLNNYVQKGIQYVICTDISKDGLLEGSSIDLYVKIMNCFPELKLIASGGVTDISELDKLIEIGVEGIIIGKAIYENKITLKELEAYVS
jgi:phosphoribosylformimino-5-aminoimidazole carboxamide ribotide isomerase